MKKGLWITAAALAAVALGSWLFLQFRMAGKAEEKAPIFICESQGDWTLVHLVPEESQGAVPRWLRPLPGGYLVAQVAKPLHQWVGLFQSGTQRELVAISCPPGVNPEFFRTAELIDAQIRPQEALVLLYRSKDGKEAPLTLLLDLKTKAVRWFHRGVGRHLALAHSDPWVFLYGAESKVWRLPLSAPTVSKEPVPFPLQGGEAIDLPPEVPNAVELLPLSAKSFLLAHTRGISARRESGAWIHHPMPPEEAGAPLKFPEILSSLARTPGGIWWQPRPGQLIQVHQDGQVVRSLDRAAFSCGELHSKDSQLLNLLGKDSQGRLWFGLAAPVLQIDAPKLAVDTKADEAEGWTPEEAAAPTVPALTPQDRTQWEDYLKGAMDRLYVWDPASGRLETLQFSEIWPKLAAPADLPQPQGDALIYPPGGGIFLGVDGKVAYLPLKNLPLKVAEGSVSH